MLNRKGKRPGRLLKGFLGITMSVTIIGTNALNVGAQEYEYPYSSKFPNGIEDTDISVFTESEIDYPLNMNWETNDEIEFVKSNSEEGQISLSEDAYEGKFALDIKSASDDLILIKETEDFSVGQAMVAPTLFSLRQTETTGGITISTSDKRVTINGVADETGKEVSIIIFDSKGGIAYINQMTSGNDGAFQFDFGLPSYDTYKINIGNATSSPITETLILDGKTYDKTITDVTIKTPESVDTKTNIVKLWIKPKYKAENISFYVTATCNGEEKQLRILGDKDNDGVFKVSEDLALGKWQQITLDLLKLEEVPDRTTVKNLYVSANEGSEWVIDSAVSDYREINSNEVDLEQFASDNVVYDENGELTFSLSDTTYNNSTKIVTGKIDADEKMSSIAVDSAFKSLTTGIITSNYSYYSIPGYSNGVWSGDFKKIFYNNTEDNNYVYCYDTENFTSTKILNKSKTVSEVSYTGNKLLFSYALYDTETKIWEELPVTSNLYLAPNGDLFKLSTSYGKECSAYKYSNGTFHEFYNMKSPNESVYFKMYFSNKSNNFIVAKDTTWSVFSNDGDSCDYITGAGCQSPRYSTNVFISNDGSTIHYTDTSAMYDSYYSYNINTHIETSTNKYLYQAADGRYFVDVSDRSYYAYDYYLYDEIAGEMEIVYGTGTNYCSERNQILDISDGQLVVTDLNMSTEYNKYLLSFDGKKTWYAYKDGKWLQASSSPTPSISEMKGNGMTKEEVNAIPEDAFGKIYANGNEVYTLNFAIGMFGSTDYITPVVKSIKVNTIANEPVDSLYSSKLFTFDKSGYNKVNGIFPVESFQMASECYYLLYLGNDWLYTYKDGKVSRLDASADELMSDLNASWMKIKQSGLSASEVRSIPRSVLTELFVNDEFANTKFGIIAVSKIKDDSTMDYAVEVKLSAETKYISEEGYVLEISLNGSDKLIFTPQDITKAEIDEFLGWIDERQNGNGNIFYRLKSGDSQSFINYYNITNVNVYKEADTTQE